MLLAGVREDTADTLLCGHLKRQRDLTRTIDEVSAMCWQAQGGDRRPNPSSCALLTTIIPFRKRIHSNNLQKAYQ